MSDMPRKNSIRLLLLSTLLVTAGCTINPSVDQTQLTQVADPAPAAQECPASCKAEVIKPKLVEYVERQAAAVGLQLGAFSQPLGANRLIKRLSTNYPIVFESRTPIIRAIQRDGSTLYRVILGPFSDTKVAEEFCKLLRQNGDACFATSFDRVDLRVDLVAES